MYTLKLFTALADRSNGQGKIEQQIIDTYMKEHSNVTVEVEALQDEPYKSKVKIYASSNALPDIIQSWGQTSFIKPLIDEGMLAELNEADFTSYSFVSGSLDGFKQAGKLYGLPRNTDFFVMYYNQKILADNGIKIPKTTQDWFAATKKLRAKGINPITTNAVEGWSLPIWFEYIAQRHTGDFTKMDDVLAGKATFTGDEQFLAAANELQQFQKDNALAEGFLTADYGASRNLFGQGKAAFFLMGSWESGLATDENFSEEFRNHVAAAPYPASEVGKLTDIAAWFGGGYSVSAHSKNKAEAIQFLKYFYAPENWAKQIWQSGAGIPAQKFDQYLTGTENNLQKGLVNIFSSISTSSGTPLQDQGTNEFKNQVMEAHQSLMDGRCTPVEFLKKLDAAVKINQ
ncbi:ABC transporter substrate-binding protein [Paenibacillus wynnii]|uniref:ABC transporter substrate-binding protein n=1 Tax=Paenibacillus wynnii TaxID=268407 RepID=UPI00278E3096|nr:extracellular solute-binding protein [Paenibacillus wynnii]MDQ0196821.1 raffinose/stachyose/melibiose transport system substrate-binding protein [Paenibacillus wynnii]